MKARLAEWSLGKSSLFLSCVLLLSCATGCTSRTEVRIRHYFGVAPNQPLQDTTIQAALLSQFPVGTQGTAVETALAARGIGKDGKSTMWRPETNQWWTGDALCCQPYDYSDGLVSMRRITVRFDLDGQQKVKQINVESFSYGL